MTHAQTPTHEVHLERILPAPPERVWQALTEPAELERWLALADVTPGTGGKVSLHFRGDDGNVQNGLILQWDAPHTLEYQWIFTGEAPSVVRFDLSEHPAGTLLTLRHRLLPLTVSVDYAPGWQAYLDRLDGHLAGDVPDFIERFSFWKSQAST